MKVNKGDFIGQSRDLSKAEISQVVAGLKAWGGWRSRSKQDEQNTTSFYHPRLVDFRFVDLTCFVMPRDKHRDEDLVGVECPPEGHSLAAVGLDPEALNLGQWRGHAESSGLGVTSFGFTAADKLFKRYPLNYAPYLTIYFGKRSVAIYCRQFDAIKGEYDVQLETFRKVIDAAGYGEKIRVWKTTENNEDRGDWLCAFEILDPSVRIRNFAADQLLQVGEPTIDFESNLSEELKERNPGVKFASGFSVSNLTVDQAMQLFEQWRAILFDGPVKLNRMEFHSLSNDSWPTAKNWLSNRLPGPWMMGHIYTRGIVEDIEDVLSSDVQEDCLIPLGYWRASTGPRLLLDAVSNGNGRWELWVHSSKCIDHKAGAVIRDEIATAATIPDLFSIPQEFVLGGSSDILFEL